MSYGFKKGVFLRLKPTFWGQKAGFKDFEPCYGCWYWVLASRLFGQRAGLFLLRLRRRKYKPVSIKPGARPIFLEIKTEYP